MTLISNEYAENILSSLGISERDEEILSQVKSKAAVVIGYMNAGGARLDPENLGDHELGVIAMGVNDLLNNAAGQTSFSPTFKMMSMQICIIGGHESEADT